MRVDVSGRVFSFPQHCVCCGVEPDRRLRISASRSRGKRVVHTTTHYWDVPCCSRCIRHQDAWKQADTVLSGMVALGIALAIALVFSTGAGAGFVAFVLALVAGVALRVHGQRQARRQCASTCATPWPAARFTGWDGSFHCFEFDSRAYCTAFMTANSGKLVNVTPEARQLLASALEDRRNELEDRRSQLLEEHQAAVVDRAQALEDDAYVRWIGRIENAHGPTVRRAEKEAALRALTRSDLREKLVLEAARIEVQAALEKAEALKSRASKMRTLRAALEAVKGEPLPEELQASHLESLEEAIAEVERQA